MTSIKEKIEQDFVQAFHEWEKTLERREKGYKLPDDLHPLPVDNQCHVHHIVYKKGTKCPQCELECKRRRERLYAESRAEIERTKRLRRAWNKAHPQEQLR